MRITVRTMLGVAMLAAMWSATAGAQQARTGLMGDLITDVKEVQAKLVDLAKATPIEKYDWRPDAGVRSTGEVFLHLASDNYLLPSALGIPADPATGINTADFKTLTTFEKQKLTKEGMVAAINASFVHLLKAMQESPDAKMGTKVQLFGQEFTTQRLWVMTVSHLHEHLGQSIAYARANHITPPWSQKGGM